MDFTISQIAQKTKRARTPPGSIFEHLVFALAWKSRDPLRFGQASRPLRQAYAVADSNVEVDIALVIVVDSLRQSRYVNAMPEPPESVEEWVESPARGRRVARTRPNG